MRHQIPINGVNKWHKILGNQPERDKLTHALKSELEDFESLEEKPHDLSVLSPKLVVAICKEVKNYPQGFEELLNNFLLFQENDLLRRYQDKISYDSELIAEVVEELQYSLEHDQLEINRAQEIYHKRIHAAIINWLDKNNYLDKKHKAAYSIACKIVSRLSESTHYSNGFKMDAKKIKLASLLLANILLENQTIIDYLQQYPNALSKFVDRFMYLLKDKPLLRTWEHFTTKINTWGTYGTELKNNLLQTHSYCTTSD